MTGAEQARLSRSRFEQPQGGVGRHAAAGVPPTTRAPQGAAGYQEVGTARSARQQRSQRDSRRAGVAQHATSRAEGVAAYSARRKKGGAGKVVRTVLIALGIILATAGGAFAWYVNNINSRLGEGITAELRQQLVEVKPQDPFYMLLLGVDKDEARAEDWGSSTANFRSDTIILARVDPPAQKVTLVSIPRDTLVDMGEHGEQKINAAYSYGGAAYMTEVVSNFAGVKISHYAELDFEQFTSIVDTIGGVEVDLPVAISDPDYAEIELPAGVQTLDGTQALGLCRSRHAYDEYGGGDFYRAANQRMVIGAIVKKVLKLDALSMSNTVSELANSVTTDFTATDILGLAMQFKDFDVDTGFYSGQTPTISSYINKGWYELPDTDAWKTMMERVNQGLPPYESSDQDITAGVAGSIGVSSGDGASSSKGSAVMSGSVLVLNGTSTSGFAANKANVLNSKGFTATADNADASDAKTTKIVYNSGSEAKAVGVAETLGVNAANISENDGSYSTKYDVVVLLGSDLA